MRAIYIALVGVFVLFVGRLYVDGKKCIRQLRRKFKDERNVKT